jgi:hypothetical protein
MIIPFVALLAALATPSVTTSASSQGSPLLSHTPQTLEEYVREYYEEDPILIEIARCESQFRHLNEDGTVLRGVVNDQDVGVMQINLYYHADDAEKLGHDLRSLEGNLAYAKALYTKKGTSPWSASKPCWGKTKKS